MEIFHTFQRQIIRNYIIGSCSAVFIVGSLLIFKTLDFTHSEIWILAAIMIFSSIIMAAAEYMMYRIHTRKLRELSRTANPSFTLYSEAYLAAQVYPVKAVKRTMTAHFFGSSIPALSITYLCIYNGILNIPSTFLLLAFIGSFLMSAMHGLIDYFLSMKIVKPMIMDISAKARARFPLALPIRSDVFLSIRRKLLISSLFLTIFPVLLSFLILLAKFRKADLAYLSSFTSSAVFFVIVLLAISLGGALLLTDNLLMPIEELSAGMLAVKNGRFEVIENTYSDEFSYLISGFNHMVEAIKSRDQKNDHLLDNIFTMLAATLDARDPYTAGHSIRVAAYAEQIGALAGLDEERLDLLRKSALVHDIGKIGIKDAVLLKEGKLTNEEFDQIKQHPVIGARIFEQYNLASELKALVPGIKYHHERFDGKGYPEGLKGEDIPLFGRIIAVADAFDAMTSDRTYRSGMTARKALQILEEGKGTQWDPLFVRLFIDKQMEPKSEAMMISG